VKGETVKSILTALVALVVAAAVAVGARADGSPYAPGLVYGASGVRAPGAALRFVTLATPKSTIVAAIRVRSGQVLRSRTLRGFYGVPIVAFDNTTGGITTDGRTLVVASYGPYPGTAGETYFVVLDTRALKKLRKIELGGSWAFDAIAPDASRMYLIEYLSAGQSPHYRVRLFDLKTGKLDAEPVVDRREDEVLMRGQPVTRKTSADGRWAYTLYARRGKPPFVHALDTLDAKAYCIDLPLHSKELEQMSLRLRLGRDGTLLVRKGDATVAIVDTEKLEARRV
jgi:hypothetical protein